MVWQNTLIYIALTWLTISVPIFLFLMILFGRLIKLQVKYWLLAKQGYHKIEHMGIDRVVRTFFLRPKDDHFEFEGGLYFQQKDASYKSSKDVMVKFPKGLDSGSESKTEEIEVDELTKLFRQIGKLKYDSDSVFLQWGIPTMYYYGNDPNPWNPADRKKVYDSKVMFAYIKRLLLEKEWKFVKMVLTLCLIGFALTLILGYLFWGTANKSTANLNMCQNMLNETMNRLIYQLNITGQNSTVIL